MNIFRILFELFVLYLLYKLIFDFIIPVFKTTQQVKKQFRDMNSRMQDHQMNQQQTPPPSFNNPPKANGTSAKKDDYIEFEEIK